MLDWRATWRDLETPPWLAILPLGSIEQHGPHLPIGTDWYIASYLGEGVARVLDAWLLPTQPYSCAQEHQDFPGTITLRPATLAVLFADIVASLGRMSVPRLVILNYHGGNMALKSIVRDLNRQQRDVTVMMLNPYEGVPGLTMTEDLHSGDFETSQWLYLQPELVRPTAEDFVPSVPPERLDQIGLRAISPQGLWGRPSAATAARGERDLAYMIEHAAQRIRDGFTEVEGFWEQATRP